MKCPAVLATQMIKTGAIAAHISEPFDNTTAVELARTLAAASPSTITRLNVTAVVSADVIAVLARATVRVPGLHVSIPGPCMW